MSRNINRRMMYSEQDHVR